jgi:hypothetical protein
MLVFIPPREADNVAIQGLTYRIRYGELSHVPNVWNEAVLEDGQGWSRSPQSFPAYVEESDGVRSSLDIRDPSIQEGPEMQIHVPSPSPHARQESQGRRITVVFCLPVDADSDADQLREEARRIARAVVSIRSPGAERY